VEVLVPEVADSEGEVPLEHGRRSEFGQREAIVAWDRGET
jgi:hypothetical protein